MLEKIGHSNIETVKPVRIDFNRLISTDVEADISESVEKAFGLDGFGGAIITNIPNFKETREKVLRNMYRLSKEPKEFLASISKKTESGLREFGWCEDSDPNPFGKISDKHVSFFSRYPDRIENIWPNTIPRFREDLIELNRLLTPPLLGLLKYFDQYLSRKIEKYKQGKFVDFVFNHYLCDNRLMVYTPLERFDSNEQGEYDWENWHIDLGLMTIVAHPIYLTEKGEKYDLDSTAFLLKDRHGKEHRGIFSEDEFMITAGEAMLIESAGYIPATPHTVKPLPETPKDVYRVQAINFFHPEMNYRMNIPTRESLEEIIERDPCKHGHGQIDSFKEGCYYTEFIDSQIEYYS
uniref:Isopenicillin N synthase n=1 Tax=Candidatus Kentrum sp. UNK TaxID=2126344 RepID=A0A451B128_9GAMM|nr:MAG: Isopenicillin N synthase [Candidatus Kentron sp. UNK]VFK71990.1 MAG: Isopenicillin N synthase [Candidatus Kentron sp. UNK]